MTATYTFDSALISDLHKDVYGYRPRDWFWAQWEAYSDADKQTVWDNLCRQLGEELIRERQEQAEAVESFERGVTAAILLGAADRQTAIRWVVEGLELDDIDLAYGGSRICYEFGLPYNMAPIFDPICKELRGRS